MTPNEVGLLVKRVQHRHHKALTAALAELGVSLIQWDTLRHLDADPNASLHDLALKTFQTDQSFGSLATRMVDRGLIERVPGPGRAVRHRITERGQEVRRAGAAMIADVLAESFASLSQEQLDQLGGLLLRVLEHEPAAATTG